MKKLALCAGLLLACLIQVNAQQKWGLQRCVDYALANNISIKQSDLQERLAKLTFIQSKLSRWPTANLQLSGGKQFGRNVDPTTNQFGTQAITYANGGLQSGVTLFNFFNIKNTIAANEFTLKAREAQTDKLRNDISLNVASAYLQALLSFEQREITAVQIAQTQAQLDVTRKRVNAGALPELNAVELESQLALDSATYTNADATYQLNLLSIKALLNLDASAPFEIETPPAELIPVEPITSLQPDMVYDAAVKTQPQQKANEYLLQSAQKFSAAAKAQQYPSLGANGSLGSSYSNAFSAYPKGLPIITYGPSGVYVPINGTNYDVYTPNQSYTAFDKATLFRQFDRNFSQSIGLSLNVPIFNGWQAKTNYRKALVNVQNQQLQMVADSQTLKQNIYQAYQSAFSALQSFNSRQKAVNAAQRSYDLGSKRYDNGLLPTLDLIILQNNLQSAKLNVASTQYDYIFRLKILEFYRDGSIKMQ